MTLFVAIQDPIIQRFAVRFVGGYLSEKTGADIKVGGLAVTPDLRVYIRDVSVKDLKDNNLATIGRLRTKIHVTDLLEGNLHFGEVVLRDADVNMVKYEGEKGFNFQFLADFFKSDKVKEKDPNKKPMPILVDKISIRNLNFEMWDQAKDDSLKTANNLMDYAHLNLTDINLEAKHFSMVGDSIFTVLERLKANDHCGLQLKHFQSDVVVCQKGIFLKDMQMETNNSLFHLDLNMKYDSFAAFKDFVNAVEFDATIYPTDALLSDIGFFTPVMYEMPNRVQLEGRFSGPIEHFSFNDMNLKFGKSTVIKGDLSMHPLNFNDGYHTLDVKSLHFTYDDLTHFYIPGNSGTIPLPEKLNTLKSGDVRLKFRGSYNNFNSDINFMSDVANLKASVNRTKKGENPSVFAGNIDAENINAGMFVKSDLIGKLDMNAGFSFSLPKGGNPQLGLDGSIRNAELLGNHIDEIVLNGDMKENRFNGKLNIDDDELYLDFNGLIDFSDKKYPKSDFEAIIRNADLHSLNINKKDTISVISANIYANMTGFDIDDLEGTLHLDSMVYRDSRGEYVMNHFDARIVNDNLMQRRISMTNDFFDFEMGGKINFASLMMSLNEYGDSFVHFPIWEEKMEKFHEYKLDHDVDQDFYAQLNLKDTKTLSRLFMPSVHIANNTSVSTTFTSRSNQFNLTARTEGVRIGDLEINDIQLKNFNTRSVAMGTLSVGQVQWTNITKNDTMAFGLDNISMVTRMSDDTIKARIVWDDESLDDHNKALVNAYFHPHQGGGIFNIEQADIILNDSLWHISPDNFIDLQSDRIRISNVLFYCNQQSLRADGYVPTHEGDTLSVELDNFDLSSADIITSYFGLDFDGFITGVALLANMKEDPMLLANLDISNFWMNGVDIGDVVVESGWNNGNQAIDANVAILYDNKRMLGAQGSYYTKRKDDNLDFNVSMDSLKLAAITPFLGGQVSRLQGFGSGNISVKGSTQKPEIQGSLKVDDGGCKVAYLNTFYRFSPTIVMDSQKIELQDMVLTDTLGNTARVSGAINHNYLKDFMLDLRMGLRNFLVMATTAKDNDTFYGNVIANGFATVKGPLNDIFLDVKARTQNGTALTLPLNRASSVTDNDFIVFVNNATEEDDDMVIIEPKKKTNFGMNIEASVTDGASMKIFLPGDIGTIDATGHGDLQMGTSSNESFSLKGNYTINSGHFLLNFKEILRKNFVLKKGGTIVWTGSPTDGQIHATGAYSVKTTLASLGGEIDSTAMGSTSVNAECLIHLSGALLNPTITFGLNLPNASEDIKQTVFSLIDTTNQAVMSDQAVSLLLFGSFSYAGSSSGTSSKTLASLASNLLSNALTMNLAKGIDLGVKYQMGSGYNTYDEYQMVLNMEFFENRLTIQTNFGVISDNNINAQQATNLVGEFDINYKLSRDGRWKVFFYNHSNYNANYSNFSFDKLAPYTQGLGVSYSRTFNIFKDLFRKPQSAFGDRPLGNRPLQTNTDNPPKTDNLPKTDKP